MPYSDPEKRKEYAKLYARKWRAENPEKSRNLSKRYRQRHPEKIRESNALPKSRAARKKWTQEHPERVKQLNKKSYLKNRMERLEYKRKNRNRQKNRECDLRRRKDGRAKKSQKKYLDKHPERLDGLKQWRLDNPDKMRIIRKLNGHKERARKKNAKGYCSPKQWRARGKYFGWKCFYCTRQLSEETATIDHKIPLSRGGTNWPSNLVPACTPCNSSKHARKPSEWKPAHSVL